MPRPLMVLFAVLFVDSLDQGMMTPILPQLFTEESSAALMLVPNRAGGLGMMWVAILGAAYAVPAFFAQPVLGQLSDRLGRRPLLLISFASSATGFFLFALGVQANALWLIVVARVIDGLAAGNLLVAQAAVADVTDGDERTRYFGYFTAVLSLGFVAGPLLGGYLGDAEAGSWHGPAAAFYVAGALNLLALAGFYLAFAETHAASDDDAAEDDFALGRSLRNAREAFADEALRPYYLTQLCYIGGYTFFMTFYAVVLEERVGMSAQTTGLFFSLLGLALMVTQVSLVDRLERWLGASRSLWIALASAGAAVAVMASATTTWWAFAGVVPFALAGGLVDPLVMSLLSRAAEDDDQGRIQGVRGSVDALGRAVPPFLAGPLAAAGAASWAVLAGTVLMGAGAGVALRLLGGEASGGPDSAGEGADGERSLIVRTPDPRGHASGAWPRGSSKR